MKSIAIAMSLLMLTSWASVEAGPAAPAFQKTYVDSSKTDIWQAVMNQLRDSDLPVVAASFERGKIRARQHNYLNRGWADCPDIDRRSFDPLSPSNLGIRAAPLYRGVDLRLQVTEAVEGTTLSLDTRYYDVGRDGGLREFAFQVSCRSTGILEQALFDAAANE